jgi:hypothetical protein
MRMVCSDLGFYRLKGGGGLASKQHSTVPIFRISVADPDPFDTDLDPTIWYRYGSGSLLFQRGYVPKTVLFIHLYLIFLVSRSNRTHTKGILCYIFPFS